MATFGRVRRTPLQSASSGCRARVPGFSALSAGLQRDARVDSNGEVSWSDPWAAAAVNELTDSGSLVLGLNVRFYDATGHLYEVPWSSFETTPRERTTP